MSRAAPSAMKPVPWLRRGLLDQLHQDLRQAAGEGVRVAVLDSGIDASHPALKGLRLTDDLAFVSEGPFLQAVQGGGDAMGHGTAIAWIIRSIAPRAEIGSFRVLDAGLRSRVGLVAEAARLALERGYHILNCSFGSPGEARLVMPYKEWLDLAYLRDVHVVAAANNHDASIREWPAWFPSVVAVHPRNMPAGSWAVRSGSLVEFAAHGQDVSVPWKDSGWRVVTGSSYAAPRVAAWLARLVSLFPGIRTDEAKILLRQLGTRSSDVDPAPNPSGDPVNRGRGSPGPSAEATRGAP